MPIAIEIYQSPHDPSLLRIDINGEKWASVGAPELADKLSEIDRAYADGNLARLLETAAGGVT